MLKRLLALTFSLCLLASSAHAQMSITPNVRKNVANTWSALQTFSSNIVSPTVIGGTGTTSTLSLQSTSGVGAAGADIIFKVGNNGATEAARITNAGDFGIGTNNPGSYSSRLSVITGGTGSHRAMIGLAPSLSDGAILYFGFGNALSNYNSGFVGFKKVGAGNTANYLSLGLYGVDEVLNIVGTNRVGMGSGNTSPASLLDLRAGDLTMSGANGQKFVVGRATELVAVGSGISTKATTIQIPADAIILAVPVYVKTKPGGTATMTVTATTSATAFQKGANISTNAGTSDPGTKNALTNYNAVAAQTVTFTFDAPTTDALGEIRVNIYYMASTPPTS